MASVDDVKRLAALARLSIPEERLEPLAAEFDRILAYIGQLDELTIDRTTPVAPALHNAFRADANAHPSGEWTEEVVRAFPQKEGDSLSVKQIISYD